MFRDIMAGGQPIHDIRQYAVDTESEVANLPTDIPMGSTAIVIATSNVYMLNSEGKWVLLGL